MEFVPLALLNVLSPSAVQLTPVQKSLVPYPRELQLGPTQVASPSKGVDCHPDTDPDSVASVVTKIPVACPKLQFGFFPLASVTLESMLIRKHRLLFVLPQLD